MNEQVKDAAWALGIDLEPSDGGWQVDHIGTIRDSVSGSISIEFHYLRGFADDLISIEAEERVEGESEGRHRTQILLDPGEALALAEYLKRAARRAMDREETRDGKEVAP